MVRIPRWIRRSATVTHSRASHRISSHVAEPPFSGIAICRAQVLSPQALATYGEYAFDSAARIAIAAVRSLSMMPGVAAARLAPHGQVLPADGHFSRMMAYRGW